MNILILAYACEPLKGSEPGVGWNLSVALSKLHNVTVLTRRNNKSAIEAYISKYPSDNINFVYHDFYSFKLPLINTGHIFLSCSLSASAIR